MSMSRRDYEMLAHVIAYAAPGVNQSRARDAGYRDARRDIAQVMANHLAAGNPNFDRARFLRACGVQP